MFNVHIVILPLLEEEEGFRELSGHAQGLVASELQHVSLPSGELLCRPHEKVKGIHPEVCQGQQITFMPCAFGSAWDCAGAGLNDACYCQCVHAGPGEKVG